MTEIQKIAKLGTDEVKRLRIQKLSSGHFFMINDKELPAGQCYLEYPDGVIKLVRISKDGREFIFIRELSRAESGKLRSKFHLAPYA